MASTTTTTAPSTVVAPANTAVALTQARRQSATELRSYRHSTGHRLRKLLLSLLAIAIIVWLMDGITNNWRSGTSWKWPWSTSSGNSSGDIACPVRTCIFVDSSAWSEKVPTGKGLGWVRSHSPDTVLEIRADGNDNRIKTWTNDKDVRFKSSAFVQVRLKEGPGAMTYFDTPSKIAKFAKSF